MTNDHRDHPDDAADGDPAEDEPAHRPDGSFPRDSFIDSEHDRGGSEVSGLRPGRAEEGDGAVGEPADVDLVVVTMAFRAVELERFSAVVSKYVVLSRMEPGCRNVDLCASMSRPDRVLVISKWESPAAQEAHVAGDVFTDFGRSCAGLLADPPDIDLWDAPSAHDLR